MANNTKLHKTSNTVLLVYYTILHEETSAFKAEEPNIQKLGPRTPLPATSLHWRRQGLLGSQYSYTVPYQAPGTGTCTNENTKNNTTSHYCICWLCCTPHCNISITKQNRTFFFHCFSSVTLSIKSYIILHVNNFISAIT